jgi:hypothetical protein
MSPRLLYLLTVGENLRHRAHRIGRDWYTRPADPLPFHDACDLDRANWAGYGAHAVAESMISRSMG